MSHAFVKNHIHLVFSTKDRQPSISKDVQPELWSYLAGICRNQKMVAIAINGMSDHAHLLFHLPPTIALADSHSASQNEFFQMDERHERRFAWQDGYGAFSVSVSNTAVVAKYIRDQEKHHRKMTFEQEYRALLKKHGIDPDAR